MRSIKIACIALLLTSSLTIPTYAQSNVIDAFTSASRRLQVKGGVITCNSVSLTWQEWYTDKDVDAYMLMWGKQQGVFTDSLNLQPYTEKIDNTSVIEGLDPATPYYAQFWRVYEEEKKVATEFTFTTQDCSNVFQPTAKKRPVFSEKITDIALYSINGKRIAFQSYTSPKGLNGMLSKATSPGTYLVCYLSGKKQLRTEHILIGQ